MSGLARGSSTRRRRAGLVVIGDVLLDVDVDGRVERTTPDAGLPVLDVTSEVTRPGGAGLAAALLAADGVPVTLVTALCRDVAGAQLQALLGEPAAACAPPIDVVTGPGEGTFRVGSDAPPTMTLNPAAMPAGTELSFGSFHLATGQQQADSALIDTSSYTCTSVPPDLDTTQSDQGGLLYGGPGPA